MIFYTVTFFFVELSRLHLLYLHLEGRWVNSWQTNAFGSSSQNDAVRFENGALGGDGFDEETKGVGYSMGHRKGHRSLAEVTSSFARAWGSKGFHTQYGFG